MATKTTTASPKASAAKATATRSRGKNGGGAATTRRGNGNVLPTNQDIATRAYAIWKAKGCPQGQDDANWREAEAQLRS